MVIVELHLKVAPEKRNNVLATIHSIVGPTVAQPDCLHCALYANTQNDDELVLLQKWNSNESLKEYMRSIEFRKVLGVMESAIERPEISFNWIETSKGIEIVESILGGG